MVRLTLPSRHDLTVWQSLQLVKYEFNTHIDDSNINIVAATVKSEKYKNATLSAKRVFSSPEPRSGVGGRGG